MHTPIIERADLQSRSQKLIFGTLTCLFWLLWLHLWSPFIAELTWVAEANDAIQTALATQHQTGGIHPSSAEEFVTMRSARS